MESRQDYLRNFYPRMAAAVFLLEKMRRAAEMPATQRRAEFIRLERDAKVRALVRQYVHPKIRYRRRLLRNAVSAFRKDLDGRERIIKAHARGAVDIGALFSGGVKDASELFEKTFGFSADAEASATPYQINFVAGSRDYRRIGLPSSTGTVFRADNLGKIAAPEMRVSGLVTATLATPDRRNATRHEAAHAFQDVYYKTMPDFLPDTAQELEGESRVKDELLSSLEERRLSPEEFKTSASDAIKTHFPNRTGAQRRKMLEGVLKVYETLKQVSSEHGVSPHLLRFFVFHTPLGKLVKTPRKNANRFLDELHAVGERYYGKITYTRARLWGTDPLHFAESIRLHRLSDADLRALSRATGKARFETIAQPDLQLIKRARSRRRERKRRPAKR